MKRRCPKCSAEWDIKGPIGFREECPECAAYLHTCGNCKLFDARTSGCRSPTTEPVRDRHEINFCEEFEFGPTDGGPGAPSPPPEEPPAKTNALGATSAPRKPNSSSKTKSSGKPNSGSDARRRFEDLFRDPQK